MTAIQIAVVILAFIVGTLIGHVLTMRYMIKFIGREHDKTQRHCRRLTDRGRYNV